MQKATPVQPPSVETVDVDMTKLYYTVAMLAVTTSGLLASNIWLWRKTKRTEEYLEAIRDLVSRLVNDTECGAAAYQSLLENMSEDELDIDPIVDFSGDDELVYDHNEPLDQDDDEPRPLLQRASDLIPRE